jgi:molybdopterin-guanine dinucleotide biosynthesis protein B
LESLQKFFDDLDLVITEGYKGAEKPKIEVVRAARHQEVLLADDSNLIAVATDVEMVMEVPVFGLEDIDQLADFIEKNYLS